MSPLRGSASWGKLEVEATQGPRVSFLPSQRFVAAAETFQPQTGVNILQVNEVIGFNLFLLKHLLLQNIHYNLRRSEGW